ncbi:hypothetical protein ACHHYP_16842 [Achlya hypogyna]|uniref:B box-type domain-containing protein n=1 Tax=Achlya hypogyna TaxID=1202772 RepID=A0A1V9Y5M9_ACHHY|nr:hypothetical protein ACHHYP_16842 [Achlya hypogyna]
MAQELGVFTRLALELEKCERYNPGHWDRVLQQSQARLRPDAPRKPSRKRPRDSLHSYLDQPDMVRDLLAPTLTPERRQSISRSRRTSVGAVPALAQPATKLSPTTLPVLRVLSPRSRQWVARLPKPTDADAMAVNQLEAFTADAIARRVHAIDKLSHKHSLYGNLHRGTSPTKPVLQGTRRRPRVLASPTIMAMPTEAAERLAMATHDTDAPSPPSRGRAVVEAAAASVKIDNGSELETRAMYAEDIDVSDVAVALVFAQRRPPEREHLAMLRSDHSHLASAAQAQIQREASALASLHDSINGVKRWLPLDLIYHHGKGPYASLHIHKAMDMVHTALVRMQFASLVHAMETWRAQTLIARQAAHAYAALTLQCWWRQVSARAEVGVRRHLRQAQAERERRLMALLATKKQVAACTITNCIRRAAAKCVRWRLAQRIAAATRLQRFYRRKTALWARFLRLLRCRRECEAATIIQSRVRGWLARRLLCLLRKIDAVELQARYAAAVAAAKAAKIRFLGAVLTIQRTIRRRNHNRKAKFAAMRRRHAKKVTAAVCVQAWWRMIAVQRMCARLARKVHPAATSVQRAWRCYRSKLTLQKLQIAKANAINLRKQAKKAFRKDQRQLARQRLQAKGMNRALLRVQEQVQHVLRNPSPAQMAKAATTLQAAWRGAKTRRRVRRLHAVTTEKTRRTQRRRQRAAATTIQRHIRGVLGRQRFWRIKVHDCARRIQRLFRSRKARQMVLDLQRYVRAVRLIIHHWLRKYVRELRANADAEASSLSRKSLVAFRGQRRAAVKIQAAARMFLQLRAFRIFVQLRQRRGELRAIGAARWPSTLRFIQNTLLRWSYGFAFVAGKQAPNGNVARRLLVRSETGAWSPVGCFGTWQAVFLAMCRYGNTADATELDNMRFSKFMKEIPGALHKTHLPLHAVDVAFAKVKVGKARSIAFGAFHTAMEQLLDQRFPDPKLGPEAKYLMFMHNHLLVSKFGEPYRLQLTNVALDRANWGAHTIQGMLRRAKQRIRQAEFLVRFRARKARERQGMAAGYLQNWWRQRLARFKFDRLVRDTYVEYVNWKSGAKSYKNLITGTTTYAKPVLLRAMVPNVSIQLPPPDEEYIVYCTKHESEPVDKAAMYCLECDDAVCLDCYTRDHKRAAFISHESVPIALCCLCSMQTATRACNQCKGGGTPFCDSCYPHYHREKPSHNFTPLVALCVECQVKAGCWKCTVCTDLFCKKCFSIFHRKGQRQHHGIERVPYLPVRAKEILDARAREAARVAQLRVTEESVERQLSELTDKQRDVAARMIQAAYRAKKERRDGKAYMKLVRRTNWIVQQRAKDDVVRRGVAYKLKKAIGVAQALASDTAAEEAAIAARKEAIKEALGLATYDYTQGPPPWCTYNAPISIIRGEFKNCRASVVSTSTLVQTGNILVFVPDAHRSVLLPLRDVRPFDEEAGGAVGRLAQSLSRATQKVQATVLNKVEEKSFALKLLHHRTEFKDIEEYAWVPSRDPITGANVYWNVVSNGRATTKPRGLMAIETMEASARDDMCAHIGEAKTKLTQLLRKTDKGAGERRASVDMTPGLTEPLTDAVFWFEHLIQHPRVGKKAAELPKHLSTNQLEAGTRLFRRLKSAVDDEAWEAAVIKFCSLPRVDKVQLVEAGAEMSVEEAIASLVHHTDKPAPRPDGQID